MKRNGYTSAGKPRYRCTSCGASSTNKPNPAVARGHELNRLLAWLQSKETQSDRAKMTTKTDRTWRRKTAWCWNVKPSIPVTGVVYDEVQLDGIYLSSRWCCLIAIAEGKPIGFQWADSENQTAWETLLSTIPAPRLAVMDGGSGLAAAIRHLWPETRVQRCLVHIQRNVRTHLTRHPKTPAGRALRKLSLDLTGIKTTHAATEWLSKLNTWHATYKTLLNERTLARDAHGLRPSHAKAGQKSWYTHDRLRKAYRSMAKPLNDKTLFTYLDPSLADFEASSTTNIIEGGTNAQLRLPLRLHRGMPPEHQRRAFEWYLTRHSANPPAPTSFIRQEHYTPQPRPTTQTEEETTGTPTYGTTPTPEDGLYTRKGWAGRP